MPISEQKRSVFRFGVFELDAASGVLRRYGIKLKLQDQPCQILTLLLERAGETITREEIRNRLWPGDTYVDFDNAINSAVRKIRDALGDASENPRFVETLARRGYRFIAPVSHEGRRPAVRDAPSTELHPVALPDPKPPTTERYLRWTFLSLAMVLIAGATAVCWWVANSKHAPSHAPLPAVPLTGNSGYEMFPAISPEGTRVAYAWEQPGRQFPDIYMKLIGQGDPIRLTTSPAGDFAPAWSPDGRWIAFLRVRQTSRTAIMIIPSLGGQEREVAELLLDSTEMLGHWKEYPVPPPYLTWSADGRWLFSVAQDQGPFSIVRVSVDSGAKRTLTFPGAGITGDGGVAISRDGKTLAFARTLGLFEKDAYLVSLSEDMLPKGDPRRLTFDNREIDGLAWTADGGGLVFSSTRGGRRELWQISVSRKSEPFRITAAGDDPRHVAIAREGHSLVYSRQIMDWDIWRMPLSVDEKQQAHSWISSTRLEFLPKYSPDGQRIAFESDRSGVDEIWISQSDASHPVQLTSMGSWAGSPRWSPDGQKIAFDGNVAGNWDIYVIPSQGGQPARLTSSKAAEFRPSWSHDGKWIYYVSTRTGQSEVWKIPATGGAEIAVTKNGGGVAYESADGNDLYYIKGQELWKKGQELWKMPVRGGDEIRVLPAILGANYVPTRRGIYFLEGAASPNTALRLRFLDFAAHNIRTIRTVSGLVCDEIAISPDERWMLFHKVVRDDSELMLIANFQ